MSVLGKQKFIRGNNSNFITKNQRNAIVNKSKHQNKYLCERTAETKNPYNKKRSLCMRFLHKNKRDYLENSDKKIVSDGVSVWRIASNLKIKKIIVEKNLSFLFKFID